MRKLNEITSDEFCDIIYAVSPILPILIDTELVQAKFMRQYNEKTTDAYEIMRTEYARAKESGETPDQSVLAEQIKVITAENSSIFVRDIAKIIPILTSKENRSIIFNVLSILEQKPANEIKKYTPPKLISKLNKIMNDTDFRSFFSYAEPSEPTGS